MKHHLYISFFLLLALLTGCKTIELEDPQGGDDSTTDELAIKVYPEELVFEGEGATIELAIQTPDSNPWNLSFSSEVDWCTTDKSEGECSSSLQVTATKNISESERRTALIINSGDADPLTVNVIQKGAKVIRPGQDQFPDPESGITIEPQKPDADQPCTIHFRPTSSSPLYDATDEIYVHIGLYADEDWQFVPAEWNENIEKCHMTKVEENHWTLEIAPTIREYFGSGETPVVKIAMVIRNADGTLKGYDKDQFNSCTDSKYSYKPFEPAAVVEAPVPAGAEYGINYNTDGSVTLVFNEKRKDGSHYNYCYLIGDETEWKRDHTYAMNRDNQKGCWWYTISADKIDPNKEYRFQYHVGDNLTHFRVSDPYTEIVYDGWNDKYIKSSTYPDLPTFPEGTKELVAAFQVNRPEYNWKVPDFKIEDKNDLVIYELLLRDFTATHDLKGAISKLDYLSKLGITAIELMPVQEFDGNESWGYNPNHYFALDKAYGNREMYKTFIDECHRRGIAVLFDVVYNHVTGIAPMAKLYYDAGKTLPENPWFNVNAPHQFSVFHDWNHENMEVREHIKRSLKYLLEEYHIDGFRFDLTKGFTQNSGTEGIYDDRRVAILKDYNSVIKETNPNAVVILEHFVDAENRALGEDGMKVWRNCNSAFKATGAGGNANLSWLRDNGVPFGTCVGFMESHDEERTLLPWSGETVSIKSFRRPAVKKETVKWGVCGTMNGWKNPSDPKCADDILMVEEGRYFVSSAVVLTTADEFKIRSYNVWNDNYNYGAHGGNYTLSIGEGYEMKLGGDSQNLKVKVAGTYDIVFEPATKKVWVMEQGKRPEPQKPDPTPQPGTGVKPVFPNTALGARMSRGALNAAFFLTVPGPKMIWQFGELGYDKSIKFGGDNTTPKPILWNYYDVPERRMLYDVYAGLLKFRAENPRFFDQDAHFEWYVSEENYPCKTIYCNVDGKSFMVIGNFSQNAQSDIKIDFKANGNWRNWFDPEDKYNGNQTTTTLRGSEFRLYVNF